MIERRRRGRGIREEKEEGYLKKKTFEKKIIVFLFCPYVNCKRDKKKEIKKETEAETEG